MGQFTQRHGTPKNMSVANAMMDIVVLIVHKKNVPQELISLEGKEIWRDAIVPDAVSVIIVQAFVNAILVTMGIDVSIRLF